MCRRLAPAPRYAVSRVWRDRTGCRGCTMPYPWTPSPRVGAAYLLAGLRVVVAVTPGSRPCVPDGRAHQGQSRPKATTRTTSRATGTTSIGPLLQHMPGLAKRGARGCEGCHGATEWLAGPLAGSVSRDRTHGNDCVLANGRVTHAHEGLLRGRGTSNAHRAEHVTARPVWHAVPGTLFKAVCRPWAVCGIITRAIIVDGLRGHRT